MQVEIRPISAASLEAIAAGGVPVDAKVADGYPTEFSVEGAQMAAKWRQLGPFHIHRTDDDVVVGEVAGSFMDDGVLEIGYSIVEPMWGRGYASAGLVQLVELARAEPEIKRLRGHAPLDRPGSLRVLEKAGFVLVAEFDDEHDGVAMRVQRWELEL